MSNENKDRLILGLKIIGLIVVAILTVIVCAGVWNARGEVFAQVCAGILIVANVIVLWCLGKRISADYVAKIREETKIK